MAADDHRPFVDNAGVESTSRGGLGDGGEAGAEGVDGRWGWGGETVVRGATSSDNGVPTYGIYSAAARVGAVLAMLEV